MKNNFLFFVESYGKNANANGNIIEIIINELKIKPVVNTVYVGTTFNNEKENKIEYIDNVYIHRFHRSLNKRIDIYLKNRNGIIYKLLLKLNYYLFQIKIRIFPFLWPLYSITLVMKYIVFYYKIRKNNINTVCVTYLHIEEVIAGILIKKLYPEINLYVYSLDAFSGRKSPKLLKSKITYYSILRWEKKVLNVCDFFCAMESHRNYYEKHKRYIQYCDKIIYFDIPYFQLRDIKPHINNKSHINIVFTGTCSLYTGSPYYILNLLFRIQNIKIHFYGSISNVILKKIKTDDKYNKFNYHGKVTRDKIIKIQNEADFLLNIGPDNECMVPCKVFEYISSKRPIISSYKIDDDPCIPYLENYRNCILIDERASFNLNLKKLEDYILNNHNIINLSNADLIKNFYNNTPYPFVDFLLKKL